VESSVADEFIQLFVDEVLPADCDEANANASKEIRLRR
jgi:hypothetical protein